MSLCAEARFLLVGDSTHRPLKNARYTHVYSEWEVLSDGEPEIHSGGLVEYNQTCTAYAEF